MEDQLARVVRTVQRRNIREIVAAVALLVLFSYGLFQEPGSGLVVAGHLIVVLASFGILGVIWVRLHIPASEMSAYPPVRYLGRWHHHLAVQARWLRFAWLWYVLPAFVGVALIVLGSTAFGLVGNTVAVLVMAVVGAGIGLLNVQASKQVEPNKVLTADYG